MKITLALREFIMVINHPTKNVQMCGVIKMAAIFVVILAVSGGLYLGTIGYSAFRWAEIQKNVDFAQKVRTILLKS